MNQCLPPVQPPAVIPVVQPQPQIPIPQIPIVQSQVGGTTGSAGTGTTVPFLLDKELKCLNYLLNITIYYLLNITNVNIFELN
jgi:hypothetical protein